MEQRFEKVRHRPDLKKAQRKPKIKRHSKLGINKGNVMKNLIFTAILTSAFSTAYAEVICTKEPTSKWKNQDAVQKELEVNYKIKKFKVTSGNCYEIYGWDKQGKKVEVYFNPVTGEIIKQRD
jgi:hypothetical protein